jgi:hypothetical protein
MHERHHPQHSASAIADRLLLLLVMLPGVEEP